MLLERGEVLEVLQVKELKRISITIDDNVLKQLDEYVRIQKIVDKSSSRSGEICKLVQKFVPSETL